MKDDHVQVVDEMTHSSDTHKENNTHDISDQEIDITR